MTNGSSSAIGAVLVLGGGISGIQASLDLASLGFRVYLIEKAPMIGGKMAQLDKTFPTNDCSMCILSPKMIECERHPNIRILTNSVIRKVEGEAGNFEVTVAMEPRYVKENVCVGCGTCTSYCPTTRPNPFDENLSSAKAIDILCPQSVPSVSTIDWNTCLYFQNKCAICLPVCPRQAIDFSQKRKTGVIHVGAIIITAGYDIFDAALAGEYGYGRISNVLHSLEFERILNASGPYQGEVLRPSDGKIPQRIAWIQCVGSRSERFGHTYCSTVCCEYAIKQLILTKEHYPEIQATIFFSDMRAYGKGYEDFYNRAKEMEGARFIRKSISTIKENRKNDNLIITYISDNNDVQEEEFDLVVLSVGLTPSEDNQAIAQMMGLRLDSHGFIYTHILSPNKTIRPGIFTSATSTNPMDIPDSIVSSTGAVSLSSQLLSHRRGTLVQPREFPEERSVEGDELKIGVFVCHCGANIGGVVDVSSIVQYASTLENVVYSEDNLFSCSSDAGRHISETIREKGLNRIVVAACTPRTHEPVFQDTLRIAGINPYLFVMANIREHCSWVHSREKEKATIKAKHIVRMAVARARYLSPLIEFALPVNREGLVLGGGLAGMTAALGLAKQGLNVYLVEKESELGGNLKNLHYTLEGVEVQPFLKELIDEVESQENINLFKGYELKSFSGSVGNFKSILEKVDQKDKADSQNSNQVELEHGITIVATGGIELKPAEYHYGECNKVVTQYELENMLVSSAVSKGLRYVAMIQCVGARNEERPYCGRICCGEAIKNALKLKELNVNTEIFIFYRDIRTYGYREDYYAMARQKGIFFIRYEPQRKPTVDINGENIALSYYDIILDMEGKLNPDLVVLSTPVVPEGNKALSHLLKVPVTSDGFFMEAHMKLRPIDSTSEGIFLCGLAHYPKYISETISQSNGAAARAATILTSDKIISSGAICEVNERKCIRCGLCQQVCPYGALEFQTNSQGLRAAYVISNLCKGCGHCNSMCPTGAISLKHFTNSQILSQISAAFQS